MKLIPIKDLTVGERYLFQLSTWSPVNLKHVTIRYIGTKYIVMHNTAKDDEYCVTIDDHECWEQGRSPLFYIDDNELF